ncbi:phage head closure protein [Sinorhizobium meliloti WSM1022]|uniref:phage head closure protein n=1 Tax=Rhizobium meliloti TaxID=382 RepID=UPI000405AC8C|nr:phage head closure protein [Sinorhizobium meliloti]MDW9841137.1 phage head closure protein [Sinorhizobium meliloti]QKN13572.1 phage head closure protein [Sinorhizobium meliloti WSM1022]
MRAGKLDRTITLERLTETLNENRTPVPAWSTIATVRTEILQQSTNEFLTGYGEAQAGTIIFRIRYLPGITTAARVTYAGTVYDLQEIKEIGRRRGLELRAVATT